jgi:putative membrane protein
MKPIQLLSATTVLFTATPALAQPPGDGEWPWHSGWGWGGMMVGGGVLMIAFWVVVILLIVLLVRWLGVSAATHHPEQARPTALDILRERYARGEIDKEEYEQRRRTLSD